MTDNSFILSGPTKNYEIQPESFGKYLFDCLRKRNNDSIVTEDGTTGEILTAEKLLEDSVKLATVLKNLKLQKSDRIAIYSENNLNYFTVVLSSLYVGAIVCPLNPAYIQGELKHALNISKPKLVICSERSLKNILSVKEELKFIENILLLGAHSENHSEITTFEDCIKNIVVDVERYIPEKISYTEDGACILLSSGTTGLPKGVLLTHQNMRHCSNLIGPEYLNTTSEDVTALVLPYFHIFAFLVQLIGIISSMKVVLLEKFKPDVFLQIIEQKEVTKIFVVPPLVLFLAKSPLVNNYNLSSLREVICGGAALGKDIQEEALHRLKTVTIKQAYGLTETGGPCTLYSKIFTSGCVGSLIPHLQAKVCDLTTKKALGPLEVGELCFKGPVIMKHYVGNSSTEKSFDDEGFYCSGDLGYYDEDKCFYIVDRIKELIKYKGFQVSPAELETLIVTYPGVKECGVIGIPDERAGQLPLAFVVRENGLNVTEQDIVDYVAKRISIQKHLYGGVRFVDEIPKNQSGKILRKKLVEMYHEKQEQKEVAK